MQPSREGGIHFLPLSRAAAVKPSSLLDLAIAMMYDTAGVCVCACASPTHTYSALLFTWLSTCTFLLLYMNCIWSFLWVHVCLYFHSIPNVDVFKCIYWQKMVLIKNMGDGVCVCDKIRRMMRVCTHTHIHTHTHNHTDWCR